MRWLFACAVLVLLVVSVQSTAAHATLERSTPRANSVLAQSPTDIRLWFTEPIEQKESRIRLFDHTGQQLPNIIVEPGNESNSLLIPLTESLDTGTYSVVWDVISAADGHPLQGYFAFTVGSTADVAPLVVPVLTETGGAPLWLQTIARWLVLLGLAITIAIWPVWLLIVWSALHENTESTRVLSYRARRIGRAAIVTTLLANLLMLAVQASFLDHDSLLSRMIETATETRFGRLWFARIGLLLLAVLAFRIVSWLDPLRHRGATIFGLLVAMSLPLPLSLNAHAAALDSGRIPAILFDYVHILTASLWFGGLIMLVGLVLRTSSLPIDRRAMLARVLPRFSAMALVCWGLLIITGLYGWWLQVGSWDAFWQTAYGRSLLFKSILAGVVLLIATANLLLITRKLMANSDSRNHWVRRLGYAMSAEVLLAVLILLAAGRMTSQQPGRETLAAERSGQTIHFDLPEREAILQLLPGAAGPNHFVVTLPGEPVPDGTRVMLRFAFGNEPIGAREAELRRTTLHTFETHGSDLGIAGDWQIELLIREPGKVDLTNTQSITLGVSGSARPKPPWRFDTGGIFGLVLMAIALLGFVVAWRVGKGRTRMESAGLGGVALLLGSLLLIQGRMQPTPGYDPGLMNPILATSDVVTKGEALFQANCISCHGAAGNGDGPLSTGMFPKPADFTAPHTQAHPDGQLFAWIQNGKPATDMPAFSSVLNDEQIWQLIHYIQITFQDKPLVEATPVAE